MLQPEEIKDGWPSGSEAGALRVWWGPRGGWCWKLCTFMSVTDDVDVTQTRQDRACLHVQNDILVWQGCQHADAHQCVTACQLGRVGKDAHQRQALL